MNTYRRCGWSKFLNVCSYISLALGLISFILAGLALGDQWRFYVAFSIVLVATGLNGLLLSFFVQMIFDCRNYLEIIALNRNPTTAANQVAQGEIQKRAESGNQGTVWSVLSTKITVGGQLDPSVRILLILFAILLGPLIIVKFLMK